jgi:TolB-like protein
MAEERRLAAILAADVVGYSRLMEQDEASTMATLKERRRGILQPLVAEHRGRIFKTTGDGVLVEFASAVNAVQCAVDLQQGMAAANGNQPADRHIVLRIGVNLGDVMVEGSDLYGDGVNIAGRLEAIAEPGGILVSGTAYDHIKNKVKVGFDDLGAQSLKNIAEPVRIYRVTGTPVVSVATSRPASEKPSIAVLPFTNMSGDSEQEYFSDGITEDIITELSKLSGLFVIARHSTFIYKGRSVTVRQVGRDLGVRYAMEGSVRKAGNRLRITAQLVDVTTDHHLWAERYDRDLADIFAVQEEVVHSVASALAVVLKPEEWERLSRTPTVNIEAYDIYLRTRATAWPPTRENILTARSAYRRITQIDPSFAGGYAGLSLTHSFAVMFGHTERPGDDAGLALEYAKASVALDDAFARGFSALGLAHTVTGQHDEAMACARRAIELQPGDADVHFFAAFPNFFAGQAQAAYEAITTALRLDPQYVYGPYLNVLGVVCFCAGRYEEAIDAFKKNVERGGPIAPPALAFRTASYSAAGYMEEAKESAQALLDFFPAFSLTRFPMFHLFKDPADTQRLIDALRQAGLPD